MSSDLSATGILVLDGAQRASLAVARSLSRAGFRVSVATSSSFDIAGWTRGVERLRLPVDPLVSSEEYADLVLKAALSTRSQMVIPVTDASADAVLERSSQWPREIVVPFASLATYRAASDKLRVHKAASKYGIGVPESTVLMSRWDPVPADGRYYPGYLKPHRSVVGESVRMKLTVRPVRDEDECRRVLDEYPDSAFPVLLQRRIEGPGEGVFVVRWKGKLLGTFAHRRLREKPPAGGVSVFRESIPLDPYLLSACESLLDELAWDGVAMIEGKRDRESGLWRVMEINGRFWGSLQLAIDAGVDFPTLLVRAALGDSPDPQHVWRLGARLRWEWGDVDHLWARLRYSRAQLRLSSDSPSRASAVFNFLSFAPRRDRLEVFRLSDPLPFLVESLGRLGRVQ